MATPESPDSSGNGKDHDPEFSEPTASAWLSVGLDGVEAGASAPGRHSKSVIRAWVLVSVLIAAVVGPAWTVGKWSVAMETVPLVLIVLGQLVVCAIVVAASCRLDEKRSRRG